MNMLLSRNRTRNRRNFSNIQIYYNREFPIEDLLDVLYPLFHQHYRDNDFISMINKADHIFCAYDIIQQRCVGCALVNNADRQGGLYLMLFGVRKSSQHHGVGTQLLEKVIQWAYRTYHTFIYLHVSVENYKAIGLYKKLGFRKQEYLPDYYHKPFNQNSDAFQMILLLR